MPRASRFSLRVTILVVMGAVASLFVPFGAPAGAGDPSPLPPDLTTRRPDDLHLVRADSEGESDLLRFSNEILNRGLGPMEMRPQGNDCDGDSETDDRTAMQRVFQDVNGDGVFDRATEGTSVVETQASCTVFHPEHNHWHFQDFALYELVKITKSGGLGKVAASSEKVGFCLVDSNHAKPNLAGSPTWRHYYGACNEEDPTGISVGWSDVYSYSLYHQWIVVDDVANGLYCLRSTADPDNKIEETNDGNNSRSIKVRLRTDTVEYEPRRHCT